MGTGKKMSRFTLNGQVLVTVASDKEEQSKDDMQMIRRLRIW